MDKREYQSKQQWTIEDSKKLYKLDKWGQNYFDLNKNGHIVFRPNQNPEGPTIDIVDIIKELKDQDISFPVVIRFQDILWGQVKNLNETFRTVISEANYQGSYCGVYPIKVNQMREVVEEIIEAGAPYNFGLEAGSKAELLAVLAMNNNTDALTILNGFKDEDYLRLALLARKLDRKAIIVVEKFSELMETIRLAEEMNVEPMIGFRAKLTTKATGKWAESGGERAKFGLTIPELVKAVNLLKGLGKEKWVKLFHFHIGSQITDIRTIKDAISEGARIFTKLIKMGLPLEYFDVGGGLGIDYDGSKSTDDSSANYTIKDYIEDIIYNIKQICDVEKVKHPNIVSESGRAISAMHSCVVTKVFDRIKFADTDFPIDQTDNEHMLLTNMRDLWSQLNENNIQETYFDVLQIKAESTNAFKLGILSLEERAKIETLSWKILKNINKFARTMENLPEELRELDDYLADQYLCNCSFFQSVPDAWAINQLFPIMPLTRLNEKPDKMCTLADITCDSDGKIDEFIHSTDFNKSLPIHRLKNDDDYYVGIFLTGAYQDVMGDQHNLFGQLNEIHIFCDDEDSTDFYIEEYLDGQTCEQVLAISQYNTGAMAFSMKKLLNKQIQGGKLAPKEGVKLTDFYEKCLKSYTYLKK